jgi:hypothetical protein
MGSTCSRAAPGSVSLLVFALSRFHSCAYMHECMSVGCGRALLVYSVVGSCFYPPHVGRCSSWQMPLLPCLALWPNTSTRALRVVPPFHAQRPPTLLRRPLIMAGTSPSSPRRWAELIVLCPPLWRSTGGALEATHRANRPFSHCRAGW